MVVALGFGGAAVAGSVLDPDPGAEESHATAGSNSGDDHGGAEPAAAEPADGGHEDDHEAAATPAGAPPGLALASGGLRLEAVQREFPVDRRKDFAFRIVDDEGEAVRSFDVEHDRRMHLIVVRRDLTGFQHLHPRMGPDGTWTTPLKLGEPGSYRVFADFSSGGGAHTLGSDLQVAGRFQPRELPHVSDTAGAGGGYEVRLAGDGDKLRFTVYAGGRRVDDVQPYLGARGHLVALREGDLAFLHVHPESAATAGGDIRFRVEYPSAGRYRLFLQFKHEGRVRTAEFTREVGLEHGH